MAGTTCTFTHVSPNDRTGCSSAVVPKMNSSASPGEMTLNDPAADPAMGRPGPCRAVPAGALHARCRRFRIWHWPLSVIK